MHEIIFSRGDVQGSGDEALLAIMDARNCGWVHQVRCHKLAEGGNGRIKAISYLIRYEGYINLLEFLQEMEKHVSTDMNIYARAVHQAWEELCLSQT